MTVDFRRLYRLKEGQRGMRVISLESLDDVGLLQGNVKPTEPIAFRHDIGNVPGDT